MIYVKFDAQTNLPVEILTSQQFFALPVEEQAANFQSRWDWTSFEEVEAIAEQISNITGTLWVGVDRGDSVSPRFDVVSTPAIGDAVSEAFNGDYRPCGHVEKITSKLQVTTTTGQKFRRVAKTASWKRVNGYTTLVSGHIDRTNPEF